MKESKKEAVERLFSEYTDSYGRITLNQAKLSDPENEVYDSENQGLWTGEAGILLRVNGFQSDVNERYKNNFDKMMKSINVGVPGLYARHPAPFWQKKHHNVSKDEYRGFMFGSAAIGKTGLPNRIISYGKLNKWFYIDDDPFGGRNFKLLGAWRQPSDRALYNIVAGRKPSIFGLLHLGISSWISSRSPKGNTSGKVLSWFEFKAIEIVGFKSKILDFFKKRVDKNLKKCYNVEYPMESVFKIYFQSDHPFHDLIKGLK